MTPLKLTVLPQHWHGVRPFDCEDASKPCPAPDCKLRIDNPAHPEVSCVIDVVEDGALPLMEVGRVLGIDKRLVLKAQASGLRKLGRRGVKAFG